MLVCEQAEAQAREQADAPVITVMSSGWHQGVIGIVAGRLKERFGRPAIVIAETEDGTGKGSGRSISGVDLGAAVLAAKESGLLSRGRRSRDGGGADASAGRSRRVSRVHQRAARRRRREIAQRPSAAARRVACARRRSREPVRCARFRRPYGAGWPSPRVAAGPVRLLKTGIVGDGHVRGIAAATTARASSGSRSGARRRELGQALLRRAADARWWLAGIDQARRVERRQCRGDASRGRRARLTLPDPSPNRRAAFKRPHRLAV